MNQVHSVPEQLERELARVRAENESLRAQLEKSLRDGAERFRLLFSQAAVGIERWDLDGRLLEVNDKLCSILGRPREELLRLSQTDLTHSADAVCERAVLARLMTGKIHHCRVEKRCLRKDGDWIWVRVTSSLARGGAGLPQWGISIVEDISDRKQTDVIVTDVQAPGMNGLDATAAVRKREEEKGLGIRDWGLEQEQQPAAACADLIPNPPSLIPVFDPEEALASCCDSLDMLREMIQYFFDEVGGSIFQMREALERGDLVKVGRLGHRMKGTIVYLGARAAKAAAIAVERFEFGGGAPAEAEQAVNALERECLALKAALAEHSPRAGVE